MLQLTFQSAVPPLTELWKEDCWHKLWFYSLCIHPRSGVYGWVAVLQWLHHAVVLLSFSSKPIREIFQDYLWEFRMISSSRLAWLQQGVGEPGRMTLLCQSLTLWARFPFKASVFLLGGTTWLNDGCVAAAQCPRHSAISRWKRWFMDRGLWVLARTLWLKPV